MRLRAGLGWFLWVGLSSCRDDALPFEDAATPETPSAGRDGAVEAGAPGWVMDPGRGAGGTTAPAAADATSTASDGHGAGAGPLSPEECQAEPVTLAEIGQGRVREGAAVSLTGVRASSQKFLVSAAKSGSCLWGAFVADAEQSGAGSGLMLVSFGQARADGEEACLPGTDGLPDQLRPGDLLAVRGTLTAYVPPACAGVAPAVQLRVDPSCPVTIVGPGALPEPATLPLELAARLAAGVDADLLRAWGGALVRLEGVSAERDADDGDAVFPFGVVRLQEGPLEVHSRLYYFDLSEGGPRAPQKAPHYDYPTRFESLTGVVFLDYCSWVLAPRDRCRDSSPASVGCDLP